MQIRFHLTDEQGRVFSGEVTLTQVPAIVAEPIVRVSSSPEFVLPVRAWAKKHAHAKSGAQIFALLAAYVAKGDPSHTIPLSQIEKLWSRMTGVLGIPYNPKHSTMAKEHGWVDSPSHGKYTVTTTWSDALREKKAS